MIETRSRINSLYERRYSSLGICKAANFNIILGYEHDIHTIQDFHTQANVHNCFYWSVSSSVVTLSEASCKSLQPSQWATQRRVLFALRMLQPRRADLHVQVVNSTISQIALCSLILILLILRHAYIKASQPST